MSEIPKSPSRGLLSRLLRILFLAAVIAVSVFIGAGSEPLVQIVSQIIASSTPTVTSTPSATPTLTPTFTPTFTPSASPTITTTPTRLSTNDPQLSYLISMPKDLKFHYTSLTDGGSLDWKGSSWIPSKPPGSGNISYEVQITYPNRRLGPYAQYGVFRTFSNLDTESGQRIRFAVTGVGSIRVGQHEYEIRSETAEFSWVRPTATPTLTPTDTSTPSKTHTPTFTPTASATHTSTPTATPTATPTFTHTHTPTNTPTFTATHTFTPSNTPTPTNTLTPTNTYTPTSTYTPTNTDTPTHTFTPSETFTPTFTPTSTFTPTNTPTASDTPTATSTFTPSPTFTPDVSKLRILFRVIPNGNVNIRSCPGTTCNPPVGVSRRGQVFEVFETVTGSDGDWYHIIFGDRTAFIAGWLTIKTSDATATFRAATATSREATSRAQSAARSRNSRATSTAKARATVASRRTVETGATYRVNFSGLFSTTCMVTPALNSSAVRNVMSIGGNDKYAVEVSIARPGSSRALSIARETLIDDGVGGKARLMILSSSSRFSPGMYTVRLDKGPYYHEVNWRIRSTAHVALVVVCN